MLYKQPFFKRLYSYLFLLLFDNDIRMVEEKEWWLKGV